MALYIGIDVGGTAVKGAVVDESGKLHGEDSVVTVKGEGLIDGIVALCNRLSKLNKEPVEGIGVGCAGVIDSENGAVVLARNLSLADFPMAKLIGEKCGLPVRITNDANAAALGEAKFGAGKNYKNSIFVTLGTGVGGGIVINGKLFEGNKSAGAEIGHMVIKYGGEPCSCGRRGCFEAYSSATALKRLTREAMRADAGSSMWGKYTPDTVTGKTAFEYAEVDPAAKRVVEEYVSYLACGLANLANAFRPEIIMLGGGVSKEGERLIAPLRKALDKEVFAAQYAPVKVECAALGTAAGAIGAAALCMRKGLKAISS